MPSIRGEIDLLDRARAALRHGSRDAAIVVLDDYLARYPHGELREEARAVRRQALGAPR